MTQLYHRSSLQMEMRIQSATSRVIKHRNMKQSIPVFGEQDRVGGYVTLSPDCSPSGRLVITVSPQGHLLPAFMKLIASFSSRVFSCITHPRCTVRNRSSTAWINENTSSSPRRHQSQSRATPVQRFVKFSNPTCKEVGALQGCTFLPLGGRTTSTSTYPEGLGLERNYLQPFLHRHLTMVWCPPARRPLLRYCIPFLHHGNPPVAVAMEPCT